MLMLNESEFPCVYALAYITNHGEGQIGPLYFTQEQMPVVRNLEQALRAQSFSNVVSFILSDNAPPPGFSDIHLAAAALGIV
jgi:hypothetical protein